MFLKNAEHRHTEAVISWNREYRVYMITNAVVESSAERCVSYKYRISKAWRLKGSTFHVQIVILLRIASSQSLQFLQMFPGLVDHPLLPRDVGRVGQLQDVGGSLVDLVLCHSVRFLRVTQNPLQKGRDVLVFSFVVRIRPEVLFPMLLSFLNCPQNSAESVLIETRHIYRNRRLQRTNPRRGKYADWDEFFFLKESVESFPAIAQLRCHGMIYFSLFVLSLSFVCFFLFPLLFSLLPPFFSFPCSIILPFVLYCNFTFTEHFVRQSVGSFTKLYPAVTAIILDIVFFQTDYILFFFLCTVQCNVFAK